MLAPFLIAAIGVQNAPASSPAGTYLPDLSQAPAKSRGTLRAVYGQSLLRISPNGTFAFAGIRQSGFWRLHQGRLVFIYQGFMGTPFAIPDEVLRRSWPEHTMEGIVLDFRGPGVLALPRMGQVRGPVLFRKRSPRTTRELLGLSHQMEEEAAFEAAYAELTEELPRRWRELADAIDDPSLPTDLRTWGAIIWHGPATREAMAKMLALVEEVNPKGLTERQARSIRRSLGMNASKMATPEEMPKLIELAQKGLISKTYVAEAVLRLRYQPAKPALLAWLGSSEPYDRGTACEALAALGARDALPAILPIAADAHARARIGAWTALARLAETDADRKTAVAALTKELTGEWLDITNAAEGLGATGLKQALRPLAGLLSSHPNPIVRRIAAEQLGVLGFKEAVPVLLDAKNGKLASSAQWDAPEGVSQETIKKLPQFLTTAIEDAPVRKAAAEALWRIGKLNRTRAKPQTHVQ